jgi:hypothetical protein
LSKDANVLPAAYFDRDRLRLVTYTADELAEYPPEMRRQLERDLATSVFGHGYETRNGKPVEQGIGAENPNANHFKALLLREQAGEEPKGAWAASVREFWKNNPEKAAALNLPRPEALAKLNAQL